jgi:Lrp/AsnC family transcriptional regulator, leucine-responsive regulatory protein
MPTIRQRNPGMDEVDERLVTLLQSDARLSMADLGRRVGLSRTATLARVRRLEDDGIIRGYHADVALAPPGQTQVARVGIVLSTPDTGTYVRRLLAIPEVSEAETVAGEIDLLVRVSAPDSSRLDEILDRING